MDTDWFDFLDLDIIATAYSVYAILKHTPEISSVTAALIESVALSLDQEHQCREEIYDLVRNFVANRQYFDSVLMEAQRKRIGKEASHWSEKESVDDIRDMHWSDPTRRAKFLNMRGTRWEPLKLARLPSDYNQVNAEWIKGLCASHTH
jgi:hypothetical protein